jgi:rSAM/selenodomain-associated transferase 1
MAMFPMNAERGNRTGLAILAKAPVPGLAKTRLIPLLGADGAAALQKWLLQRTVAIAVAADVGPVTLWCAPAVGHPEFSACRNRGQVVLRRQAPGDLGARMHAAVAGSPAPVGVLVVGTDCPVLTPGLLRRAAASLDQDDATVIPAEDGGYVLIGMRHPSRRVFKNTDFGREKA